jgi:hypothetical protein
MMFHSGLPTLSALLCSPASPAAPTDSPLRPEQLSGCKDVPPNDGVDPYSVTVPLAPQKSPRRTLDDMRKLSEEIKRSRQRK